MHPFLFHSGHLYLPTFGALAALGLMCALALSLRTAAWCGLNPDAVWDAGLFGVVAAFGLSRLLLVATNFHSFLAYPLLLLAVPSLTPMGLLLTATATGVWIWMHRLPLAKTLDAWAPCATLIWAFLALGHWAEGSDPGMPTTSWLGMAAAPGIAQRMYPVALYGSLAGLGLTLALLAYLRRGLVRSAAGTGFALALAGVGTAQFLLSFLRQPGFESNPQGGLLDPLQWVALAMIATAGGLFLKAGARRSPGSGVSGPSGSGSLSSNSYSQGSLAENPISTK